MPGCHVPEDQLLDFGNPTRSNDVPVLEIRLHCSQLQIMARRRILEADDEDEMGIEEG